MNHTKGRLVAIGDWIGLEDESIAVAYITASGDEETNEANARRLVACWNACEGIPLEQLECDQPTFVRMLMERQTLKQERDELQSENERLREAADRAEGFLFAVSLMPQLGPKIQGAALKHHDALRSAMKEAKE